MRLAFLVTCKSWKNDKTSVKRFVRVTLSSVSKPVNRLGSISKPVNHLGSVSESFENIVITFYLYKEKHFEAF